MIAALLMTDRLDDNYFIDRQHVGAHDAIELRRQSGKVGQNRVKRTAGLNL
jgi:hypothetical protein